MTLERFETLLREGDAEQRTHLIAKLMRQAKPDDVFEFVTLSQIEAIWPTLRLKLGKTHAFWTWWMERWGVASSG